MWGSYRTCCVLLLLLWFIKLLRPSEESKDINVDKSAASDFVECRAITGSRSSVLTDTRLLQNNHLHTHTTRVTYPSAVCLSM